MKYRILFTLNCFLFAAYTIVVFPIWFITGKCPFGNKIDKHLDNLSAKCFSGWSAYYDALEKEYLNNPFLPDSYKTNYNKQTSYRCKKQMLDAYDADANKIFNKITSYF